jgi:hypothetical protein
MTPWYSLLQEMYLLFNTAVWIILEIEPDAVPLLREPPGLCSSTFVWYSWSYWTACYLCLQFVALEGEGPAADLWWALSTLEEYRASESLQQSPQE